MRHADDHRPHLSDLADLMLGSTADGVFAVDEHRRILAMNPAALAAVGRTEAEVLGRPCHEVLRFHICREQCALRAARDAGRPIANLPVEVLHRDGRRTPTILSSAVLRDARGHDIGGVETFRDLEAAVRADAFDARRNPLGELLAVDPAMRGLVDLLPTIAPTDSAILLTGETGTGKNLVARAIHALSGRGDGPLVTVNCAALPESLLESELFGYRAGAFTGAERDRAGRIAAAEGGTLFLDEIGDIPLPMQVKLLRFLQSKTYEPLGDVTPRRADVRILAATHQDLQELVEQGRFRQDLYYRINVVNLPLPPLRDRPLDIPVLAHRFLELLGSRRGKQVASIAPDALDALVAHGFPGNVRELENVIEHAYVFCDGPVLLRRHLPERVLRGGAAPRDAADDLRRLERRHLEAVLARHDGHRGAAAEDLGIHRTTLLRRMKRLGIRTPERDGRRRDPGSMR
ncbi:MAG TPA: sigma 54-interacting transcriptional regulator [Candidatus Krumholzibacteria bacterium]|nr:sigma 54-interacting transcriptional regulator [Candidatus Krumholzibacteria bacterium]HRX52153.1 sigma 54-interacting transcriptional regulator [Candidatus Krumholzibacteria bacterium]